MGLLIVVTAGAALVARDHLVTGVTEVGSVTEVAERVRSHVPATGLAGFWFLKRRSKLMAEEAARVETERAAMAKPRASCLRSCIASLRHWECGPFRETTSSTAAAIGACACLMRPASSCSAIAGLNCGRA